MFKNNGKLVELPRKGIALIVTDIHGNITDFKKFMDIWSSFDDDDDNHLILTGDFIHAMGLDNDQSVEILEYVKFRYENSNNFHVLLGNHEWATMSNKVLYKAGINQTHNFDELLKEKFQDDCKKKREEYIEFFKELPIAVRTDNRIFISHAGPPHDIHSLDEIANIKNEGYNNPKLIEFLWSRKDDFTKNVLETFLDTVNCKFMVVGHTPVDGIKLIYKKQLIVSSSYGKGKKAYVELDLEKEINKSKDLLKMVKYIK
jgi:serine/threonine-protein phosphatase PP1 catalytic subunit